MGSIAKFIFIWIFFITVAVGAGQGPVQVYIVKKGDSLSAIADRIKGGHTYGKGENLEKLLQLNPRIKDGHKIYVGEPLIIPADVHPAIITSTEEPSLTSAPLSEPVPEHIQDIPHRFQLYAGYKFTTLEAQDVTTTAMAHLYTKHGIEVGASWWQQWSEDFSTHLDIFLHALEFMPSTNPTKNLSRPSQTLTYLMVGGQNHLTKALTLYYDVGYGQELFVHGLSTTDITVDSIALSKARLGLSYDFLTRGLTSLGFSLDAGYLGSATSDSYDVDSGITYSGALFMRRLKDQSLFSLEIGLGQRLQKSSVVEISEQNIFGRLTYGFDLFGRKQ